MPTDARLTEAQKWARDWLPEDGSWRMNPGRLASALSSLSIAWPGCVEAQCGWFGPRYGVCKRWRLTAKGVDARRIVANAR